MRSSGFVQWKNASLCIRIFHFFLAKMRKMKKHPSNFAKTIDNFMQNGYNKDTILFIRRLEEF